SSAKKASPFLSEDCMTREESIRESFERQARACETLGSPFTARLCRLAAANLGTSGPVGRAILEWPGDASGGADALPLRFAGALHALVLSGQDADLQTVYPPDHVADEDLWRGMDAAMKRHPSFI